MDLEAEIIVAALRELGSECECRTIQGPIEVVLAGGAAGLLGGWLRASRVTQDCDVIWTTAGDAWSQLEDAARDVAVRRGLAGSWFNRDCQIYAWYLPLGWRERCDRVGRFGPLDVARISRLDLMAGKVMSCAKRPHDLEDLLDMSPTSAELNLLGEHLDRLQSEDLGGREFTYERTIVRRLRGGQ